MFLTIVCLGQIKVSDPLLVEAEVPAHHDVVLGLGLLQLAIIVCLQLDKGTEDALVLVRIIIPDTGNFRNEPSFGKMWFYACA